MKVKHSANKHNANLSSKLCVMHNSIKNLDKVYIRFTEDSKYFTKDRKNQASWSKIIGRKSLKINLKTKIANHSDIIAWRYLDDIDRFQVAFYQRVNGKFKYKILYSDLKVDDTAIIQYDKLISKRNLPLPSGPYFGGQEPAPNDLFYYLSFVYK
jgi:hypothetical protein